MLCAKLEVSDKITMLREERYGVGHNACLLKYCNDKTKKVYTIQDAPSLLQLLTFSLKKSVKVRKGAVM